MYCWVRCCGCCSGAGLYELGTLSGALPELLESLGAVTERLQAWLDRMVSQVPDGLGRLLQLGIDQFFQGGQALFSRVCEQALRIVSAARGQDSQRLSVSGDRHSLQLYVCRRASGAAHFCKARCPPPAGPTM